MMKNWMCSVLGSQLAFDDSLMYLRKFVVGDVHVVLMIVMSDTDA